MCCRVKTMYDPFMRNSPKTIHAAALLEEGDLINAVKLWGEAMEAHGKCGLFCEKSPQSSPIHVCASCFEDRLRNAAIYSQLGTNDDDEKFDYLARAQKLRDWLISLSSDDVSELRQGQQ